MYSSSLRGKLLRGVQQSDRHRLPAPRSTVCTEYICSEYPTLIVQSLRFLAACLRCLNLYSIRPYFSSLVYFAILFMTQSIHIAPCMSHHHMSTKPVQIGPGRAPCTGR